MRRFSTIWPGITPPVKKKAEEAAEAKKAKDEAKQALALAGRKRSYFEDQLKKFINAAQN